ncbi:475_t:CDS:2 [Funneliformis mosseae]|uniref:475_t:CDS:1 n=1 Tax=Funneliformis mosseae TaxID=27381 RepID=A0A9N9EK64_FUNMO|nr:475_t:CDS:2 [Funneliformis mosseae]
MLSILIQSFSLSSILPIFFIIDSKGVRTDGEEIEADKDIEINDEGANIDDDKAKTNNKRIDANIEINDVDVKIDNDKAEVNGKGVGTDITLI